MGCNGWRLLAQETPSEDATERSAVGGLMIHDDVLTHAQSSGGKYAKIKAAQKALVILDGVTPSEFRQRFK